MRPLGTDRIDGIEGINAATGALDPITWLIERALQAAGRGDPLAPAPALLLLRGFVSTGRLDLSEALGAALASALESAPAEGDAGRRCEWIALFTEAAAISEDERLGPAVQKIAEGCRDRWPSRRDVASAMRSVDACLLASGLAGATLISPAIDELERVVGLTYEPGDGIGRALDRKTSERGSLLDHVAAASALLTAHAVTGRLPYSMLAEELMQVARREWWNRQGGFRRTARDGGAAASDVEPAAANEFILNCEAARVLCRLALLHRDPEYLQSSVTASEADYQADAARTLAALAERYQTLGVDAAVYGVALGELQALG